MQGDTGDFSPDPFSNHHGILTLTFDLRDFIYAAKLGRIERMIHHYGSGLNAIPLLDAYKYNSAPSSAAALHDLRVGYGGTMGAITNINQQGFGSVAFHSFPETMKWDAYSGDYGCSFLGHVLASRTNLVESPDFGWIGFGGEVEENGDGKVIVRPTDMVQRRVYVAAMGLSVEFDAGVIERFVYDPQGRRLRVEVGRVEGEGAVEARMIWEDTLGKGVRIVTTEGLEERGGGFQVGLPGVVEFAM